MRRDRLSTADRDHRYPLVFEFLPLPRSERLDGAEIAHAFDQQHGAVLDRSAVTAGDGRRRGSDMGHGMLSS